MIATMNVSQPSVINTPKTKSRGPKSLKPLRKKSPRQIITTGAGHVFSKFVSHISVRPNKQLTVPIGNTFTGNTPRGFSISLSPGNDIEESVDMKVTAHAVDKSTPSKFEYKLHVANNGIRTISAEVWAL